MIYLYVYLVGSLVTFCFNVEYSMQIEEISLEQNAIRSIGWPAMWMIYFFAKLMSWYKRG